MTTSDFRRNRSSDRVHLVIDAVANDWIAPCSSGRQEITSGRAA